MTEQITGTYTRPCPRCNQVGSDAFGPQGAMGWHEGCAADEKWEHLRDEAAEDRRGE